MRAYVASPSEIPGRRWRRYEGQPHRRVVRRQHKQARAAGVRAIAEGMRDDSRAQIAREVEAEPPPEPLFSSAAMRAQWETAEKTIRDAGEDPRALLAEAAKAFLPEKAARVRRSSLASVALPGPDEAQEPDGGP